MDKISKTTGQRKQAGPANPSVSKTTARRCKASADGYTDAPVESCAETAKASDKCSQRSRSHTWQNRDLFQAELKAAEQGVSVQKQDGPQPDKHAQRPSRPTSHP